jgi:hypothetical protein
LELASFAVKMNYFLSHLSSSSTKFDCRRTHAANAK